MFRRLALAVSECVVDNNSDGDDDEEAVTVTAPANGRERDNNDILYPRAPTTNLWIIFGKTVAVMALQIVVLSTFHSACFDCR
jgi:hypothetical protein